MEAGSHGRGLGAWEPGGLGAMKGGPVVGQMVVLARHCPISKDGGGRLVQAWAGAAAGHGSAARRAAGPVLGRAGMKEGAARHNHGERRASGGGSMSPMAAPGPGIGGKGWHFAVGETGGGGGQWLRRRRPVDEKGSQPERAAAGVRERPARGGGGGADPPPLCTFSSAPFPLRPSHAAPSRSPPPRTGPPRGAGRVLLALADRRAQLAR